MNRREFLLTATAAAVPVSAAFAEETPLAPGLPEHFMPRYVRIGAETAHFELHVVPREFALYWTLPDRRAIRYSVGIGRPGLYEAGEFFIGAKKEWPAWTPTPEMIARQPELYAKWKNGMPGGPGNPLGARALYLFTPQRGDTFLRIHGTADPSGIGREVSNGCARLVNPHIVHLYEQVPLNTRAVLHPKGA